MDAKEAFALIQNNIALLMDIREADELAESGIAKGATWMPTSKMAENHPDWTAFKASHPKDKALIMYCRSGGRVTRVAAMLAMEGFTVENIGGFKDWQAAGLPTEPFTG